MIGKSTRFEHLVNNACIIFYKKPSSAVSEDSVNFIRRSIHELLRSKSMKEQLRSQLLTTNGIMTHPLDVISTSYEYIDNGMYMSSQPPEDNRYIHNVADL